MKMFRLNIKPLAHNVRDFAILSKKIYLRSKIPLRLKYCENREIRKKMYDTLAPMKTGSYCGIVIITYNVEITTEVSNLLDNNNKDEKKIW